MMRYEIKLVQGENGRSVHILQIGDNAGEYIHNHFIVPEDEYLRVFMIDPKFYHTMDDKQFDEWLEHVLDKNDDIDEYIDKLTEDYPDEE